VKNETELGLKAKAFMDRGDLVPDDLVIGLIRERLSEEDCAGGFLLDGFPRTVEQARALKTLLEELSAPISHVLNIDVSEEVLLDRIVKRGAEGSGRSDDNVEVAKNRLQVYHAQTAPVTAFYVEQGLVVDVDGIGTIDVVRDRLESALQAPVAANG
jgi:adenylate kinase